MVAAETQGQAEEEEAGKAKSRKRKAASETTVNWQGQEKEKLRAVMGFVLTRLNQDLFVELMDNFQPAVSLQGVYL
jgi:hypothetical protein